MILSWANSETEAIWNKRFSQLLPDDIPRTAKRKLIQIHSAKALTDLRVPQGIRLEKLLGDRKDEWSIRINDPNTHQKGRICFLWENGNALKVGIVDYHQETDMEERITPIHPGEILLEDFLNPMGISAYKLAKSTLLDQTRISEIIRGKRSISVETALRFSKFFGTSPEFWINIQAQYDLEKKREELAEDLSRIHPFPVQN